MNKIIILCAVFSSVLFAEIDERKSDIYYGNGIMTTKAEARASKELIKTATLNDIYHGDQVKMDKLHTFDLAYNYSAKEKFENTMIATVLDLMESYEQMGNTSFGWGAVTSVLNLIGGRIAIVSKWTTKRVSNFFVKEGVPALAASFLAKEIVGASKTRLLEMAVNFFQYDPTEIHDNNLKEMVEKYTTSIKDGHGIILVTHSQGNLFAIEATNRVNFSMGIQAFKPWMRNYVHHVSIASPATKFASDSHWLTSLDNDVVANNPGAVGPKLRNPIRYFTHKADSISPAMNIDATREWTDNPPLDDSSPDGYWLDKVTPPSFTKTVQADSGFGTVGVIQDFTMHVVPEEWEYSATEFHALNYYMGLTAFQANIGGGKKVTQKSDETRKKIIEDIESAIQKHRSSPSQWEKFESIGCGCDGRITLKHIELYGGIYSLMQGIKVLEFKPDGKVYQVDGNYIKASPEGTTIDDQTSLDNGICYVLDGTGEQIDGSTGLGVQPHSGVLESTLSWKSPDIELKLRVSGPTTGIYDLENSECPTRHWYIATENEVKEGTYFISINNIGTTAIDENLFPQKVKLNVGAPDGGLEFTIDIQNASDLNMGTVVKVTISKQSGSSGGSGSIGVTVEATETVKYSKYVSVNTYKITEEGTRYDYKTESLLNKVELGPLAGALFEVSRYTNPYAVIYTGSTSSGFRLEDNGLMLLPDELKNSVIDEELYLITAKGGQDVDANDDFVMDSTPTVNLGEIHAILSGADIKNGSLKVNAMTEIAYQVFAQSSETNITKIKMGLDTVAQKLFREDVNSDKTIDRADLHAWLPGFDKNKLHDNLSYGMYIESIVQKIYRNEDISADIDQLIPSLIANAGPDISTGQTQPLILDASQSYDINGDILSYSWSDGSSVICQSDTPICEPKMLDYGQHYIVLRVTDNNGNTAEDVVSITINSFAPVAKAGIDQEIFMPSDIRLDASSSYDSNGQIVDYTWTSSNGTVYCQGSNPVCVINALPVADYTFTLTVTDNEGLTGRDFMKVIYPHNPVAMAGSDVTIDFTQTVVLDAVGSYDNDGYITGYRWEKSGEVFCEGAQSSCILENLRSGTHLFKLTVTDNYGTQGYDFVEIKVISSRPYTIGAYNTPGYAQDVVLSPAEDIAYIADGSSGIQIIDISNPTTPTLLANYKVPGYAFNVTSSEDGKTLYVADAGAGLIILDITNPVAPVLVGNYTAYEGYDIEISSDGNTAYLADGFNGVQIIDISNPTTPVLLGNYDTFGDAYNITISADGNIAYIADYYSGFQIIDISNPQAPFLLSSYDTTGYTQHIKLSSDEKIAYVADGSNGVLIFDISNPASPFIIGSYKTPDAAQSIKLSIDGSVAYVANAGNGVEIINVNVPSVPSIVGAYNTPGTALYMSLMQSDTIVYIADGSSGLQIVDISAFAP